MSWKEVSENPWKRSRSSMAGKNAFCERTCCNKNIKKTHSHSPWLSNFSGHQQLGCSWRRVTSPYPWPRWRKRDDGKQNLWGNKWRWGAKPLFWYTVIWIWSNYPDWCDLSVSVDDFSISSSCYKPNSFCGGETGREVFCFFFKAYYCCDLVRCFSNRRNFQRHGI